MTCSRMNVRSVVHTGKHEGKVEQILDQAFHDLYMVSPKPHGQTDPGSGTRDAADHFKFCTMRIEQVLGFVAAFGLSAKDIWTTIG